MNPANVAQAFLPVRFSLDQNRTGVFEGMKIRQAGCHGALEEHRELLA
ncbi:MAG TPA: hypothetical protein VEU62_06940 [Bryobacterales bacterium]|nr:hypothetical protein [Bryobacterales bacterium]